MLIPRFFYIKNQVNWSVSVHFVTWLSSLQSLDRSYPTWTWRRFALAKLRIFTAYRHFRFGIVCVLRLVVNPQDDYSTCHLARLRNRPTINDGFSPSIWHAGLEETHFNHVHYVCLRNWQNNYIAGAIYCVKSCLNLTEINSPKLHITGLRISIAWAHERLKYRVVHPVCPKNSWIFHPQL